MVAPLTQVPRSGADWLRLAAAPFVLVCLILPSAALAQSAQTADELKTRARTGDVIYVMDAEGRETKGTLLALSDTTLTVGLLGDRYDVPLQRVARVEREGDSAWSGFAIGASIGAAMGLLTAQGCSGDFSFQPMLSAALVYGGIGALIDYAHTGRTRLYSAPLEGGHKTMAIAPILSRERRGAALAIRW